MHINTEYWPGHSFKEKGNLVSNERQLATIMSKFFINITKDLELQEDKSSNTNTLEDVLKVFNTHSSVERIKRNIKVIDIFFQQITEDLMPKIVLNLDSFKATPVGDFIKKRLWHRCFPVNFAKFLRAPSSQNTSGRLLLK